MSTPVVSIDLSPPIRYALLDNDPMWMPMESNNDGYDVRVNLRAQNGGENKLVQLRDKQATSYLSNSESFTFSPGDEATVGTGLWIMEPLPSYVGLMIAPRSSTGKKSITVRNSPAIIDTREYLGREILIMLRNDGQDRHVIAHGDRLVQFFYPLLARPQQLSGRFTDVVPGERAGFGSSGR